MSNAEKIAIAFGKAHKSTKGWQCLCPCHDDNTPSLGIVDKEDGSVVFNCLANCNWQDIQRVAEDRGLIHKFEPRDMQNANSNNTNQKTIIYPYRDENDVERFQKIRRLPKSFSINRIENNQIISGLNGQKVPLYNLSSVIKSDTVYITEGEKDADNLISHGLCATTNIAGGAHWDESFTDVLRNKTIIICQDNDDTGRKRTEKIKLHLLGKVKEIFLFAPKDMPDKADVTDWLNLGGDASEIIFYSTSIYKAPEKLQALRVSNWLESPTTEAIPILPGVFDIGDKVVIIGQSKTRKSFFAQQLAFCVAGNRRFLEFDTIPKKVLLIQFEIRKERYHLRCKRMATGMEIGSNELDDLMILNARGFGIVTEDLKTLMKEQVETHKPEVVIIDPLYKLIDGDESKSEEIKPILRFFDKLAEDSKAAIVYIHHDKKGHAGDQQTVDRGAGSGVLARDFDAAIYLTPHKDKEDHLVVEFITRNYATKKPFTAEWRENHFIWSPIPPEKQTARSAQNKQTPVESLADKAKDFIRKEMISGETKIPVALFREKLGNIGVPEKRRTVVIQELVKEGVIAEENLKPKEGRTAKFIVFLTFPENPAESSESSESSEGEFKDNLLQYEDELF